jgi:CHAT domain-containing protein/tetratricopeptide (TPR) repeat protein
MAIRSETHKTESAGPVASGGTAVGNCLALPEALRGIVLSLHSACTRLLQLSGPKPSSVWLELSGRAVILLQSLLDEAPQTESALAVHRRHLNEINEQLSTVDASSYGDKADERNAGSNSSDLLEWPITLAACLEAFAGLQMRRGDREGALKLDLQLLELHQHQIDSQDSTVARCLHRVARHYFWLGLYGVALQYCEDAVSLGDCPHGADAGESIRMHLTLARTHSALGQLSSAYAALAKATSVAESVFAAGSEKLLPLLEASVHLDLSTGRLDRAYTAAREALSISSKTKGKQSFSYARALNRFGGVLATIGDTKRAEPVFKRALQLLARHRGENGEAPECLEEIASATANLAGTFLATGRSKSACSMYEQALVLRRAISKEDHPETVRILSYSAFALVELRNFSRALSLLTKAHNLKVAALGRRHPDVARGLLEIGYIQWQMRDFSVALEILLESIVILACGEFRSTTARAMFLLAILYESIAPEASILFGKVAVNMLQDIKSNMQQFGPLGASSRLGKAFFDTREEPYRLLGESLIVSGRLPEAQEVLGILKNAELQNIAPDVELRRTFYASLTSTEQYWNGELEVAFAEIKEIGSSGAGDLETFRRGKESLHRLLEAITREFSSVETTRVGLSTGERGGDLGDIARGIAQVQYLIGNDHLRFILTSSELQKDFVIPVRVEELHRLVYDCRTALQHRSGTHLSSLQKLYEILLAPAMPDLKAGSIQTLRFSLDGVLRYVPMCALHDGDSYLVEKFASTIGTGPVIGSLTNDKDLLAFGLGNSRGMSGHPALPGVAAELHGIIRTEKSPDGVLPGQIIRDRDFTADALRRALRLGSIVHLASHFVFRTAQELSSYLLLGDGNRLSLADFANLRFDQVELLGLSACNTATGGGHAQGREVEGLGTLVRDRGAKAVLATLWPVADTAGAKLMRMFYRNLYNSGMPLPDALRLAQSSMLASEIQAGAEDLVARGFIDPEIADLRTEPVHPYYWAPYLLMGGQR